MRRQSNKSYTSGLLPTFKKGLGGKSPGDHGTQMRKNFAGRRCILSQ